MSKTCCPECGCVFEVKEGNLQRLLQLIKELENPVFSDLRRKYHLSKVAMNKHLKELRARGKIGKEWGKYYAISQEEDSSA